MRQRKSREIAHSVIEQCNKNISDQHDANKDMSLCKNNNNGGKTIIKTNHISDTTQNNVKEMQHIQLIRDPIGGRPICMMLQKKIVMIK